MFCLASRYQTESKNLNEVAAIVKEQGLPLVSRQKGFSGAYLLTQVNGVFMTLNIWDTEEQANAWLQNPEHQKIVAQLQPLLAGAPAREGWEVRANAVMHG